MPGTSVLRISLKASCQKNHLENPAKLITLCSTKWGKADVNVLIIFKKIAKNTLYLMC